MTARHTGITRLTTLVERLWNTDPPLTATGVLMFVALAASVAGMVVDPRTILGAPAWLKPAKFAASFVAYTLTLAWVFTYLPDWVKTRRIASWVTVATLVVEALIIDLQAWRGTTSHFNVGTPLDGILFGVMGLAIVVQTIAAIAVAVALWRQRFADTALGWALCLGITITIIGAASGGLMTRPTAAQLAEARVTNRIPVVGAHTVGAPDGGPGLPGTGWSREHGDIRVAHFLGLHALQMLPLIALILARTGWHDARRVRVMLAAAASYLVLFALLLWQALRGQSVIDPDPTTITAFASWATLSVAAIWLASSRSTSLPAHAVVY
jgi:hypothetical protein